MLVSITAFLLFCAVLACLLMSKLTLLSLVSRVSFALEPHPTSNMRMEGHVALAMLSVAVFVPHAWALLLSLWKSCYKSRPNNPNPSLNALLVTFLFVVLEMAGVVLFFFVVAPRITSADTLVAMTIVFAATACAWMRQKDRPFDVNDNVGRPLLDLTEVSTNGTRAWSPTNRSIGLGLERSNQEKYVTIMGFIMQVLLVLGFPVYLYFFTHTPIWACALLPVSVMMVSIAWVPQLQE